MRTSGHLDWLSVTFPAGFKPNDTIPHSKTGLTWIKSGRPSLGYQTRLTNELGAVLLKDGEARRGVHLILTGEALAQTRKGGVTDRQLCQHVTANDGKLTRLDTAIDIFDGKLTVLDLAKAYAKGTLKTPAKAAKRVHGINNPSDTLYIGSSASDRFLRAYNKAAQMGIDGEAWLRLELELKKERAQSVANVIATEDNTRRVINRVIGDYLQMPDSDELNEVLGDQSDPLPAEGRKLHNTYRWLLEQVAPAMARYQLDNPNEDVVEALLEAYRQECLRIEKQRKRDNG